MASLAPIIELGPMSSVSKLAVPWCPRVGDTCCWPLTGLASSKASAFGSILVVAALPATLESTIVASAAVATFLELPALVGWECGKI